MRTQITAIVAGALVLGSAGAMAQTADLTSRVDRGRTTAVAAPGTDQSPGTIGAMNAVVAGVATSAEDIRRQQEGRSSALDGARDGVSPHASAAIGQSPGTVGAMPGN